jgi:hypothetical protein
MAPKLSSAPPFALPVLDDGVFTGPQQEAVKRLNKQLREWHTLLNGAISLGTAFGAGAGHLDAELVQVTTTAGAGVDFPAAHNLGRTPVGVFLLLSEGPTPLYRAATTPAHNDKMIWLRSSEAVGTRYWVLVF